MTARHLVTSAEPGLGRVIAGVWSWPLADKAAFVFALPVIVLTASLIRLVPIRRLAWLLGSPLGAVSYVPLANPSQLKRARLIRRSIRRAARVTPLRGDCLPQALAGAMLCRWLAVPVTIHLGVRRSDAAKAFETHAWSCSGSVAVTGGIGFDQFVTVSCFASF